MGKRPKGLQDLSERWKQWSLATKTPLTTELMLSGRDEDAARVMRWLQGPPAVLSVQAESVEEATAFLYAAISELPPSYREAYLSRGLVPSDDSDALALADSSSPLILILRDSADGLPQSAAARGHHVFVAFGSESGTPSDVLTLTRPRRDLIEQALQAMEISRQDAHNLARDSGRSLTVLRRLMPPAPGRKPMWSQHRPPRSLIAALLAGGWSEGADGDKAAMEALSGLSYAEVTRELAPLLAAFDGPLRKSGDAWKVASPRDAWVLVAKFITRVDLDRYLTVFSQVLSEKDPRYDLDAKERWMANMRGIGLTRSGLLRLGLTETLILLALWGDQGPQIADPVTIAEGAVSKLLGAADAKLWWSLQSDFRRFAEAAPSAFLNALRIALRADPTPISALFSRDEDTSFGREYLSELLWALESLAWDADLLPHVVDVLAALAAIDPPGGRWANRPSNTLRHIFLLWNPQTHASLSERLKVIDGLRKRWPAQAWALLLAIIPKMHDMATPTAYPRWRDFAVNRQESVTIGLIASGAKAVADRLLADVGLNGSRWSQLIELFGNFETDVRLDVGRLLATTVPSIVDAADRKVIRTALRRMLHHHREFPDADWSIPESELGDFQIAYDLLAPDDVVERHSWLFASGATPEHPAAGGWQNAAARLDKLRLEVVAEIGEREGREGILRLAHAAEQPGWIGNAVMTLPVTAPFRDDLLKMGLLTDSGSEWDLAWGMMVTAVGLEGLASVRRLLPRAKEGDWGGRAMTRILHAAPGSRETWTLATDSGPEVEDAYWNGVALWGLQGSPEDIAWATEQLLRVRRARHAVHFIGSHLKDGIPSSLIIQALREAVSDSRASLDNQNEAVMFTHYVGELLNQLEADVEVSRSDIISLEWAYYQVLRYSQRPARTLQKALATEPSFFMQILQAVYIPSKESGVVEPQPADPERAAAIASQAWGLLHDWNCIPGADENGVIDAAAVQKWVSAVRAAAVSCGRLEVCDARIGDIFAASRPDPDGTWPPTPIRDIIEQIRSSDLENGVRVGVVNRLGVTTRLPTDGGAQERVLAVRYRKNAREVAHEWPQTAALLERIAKGFDADSKREDEEVERREWL
jgi:hypothetical protein